LKGTGNRVAADKWLARWTPDAFNEPDSTSPTYKEDARKYMRAKYIEKKWVKLPPPLPIGVLERNANNNNDSSPTRGTPMCSPGRSSPPLSPIARIEISPDYVDMSPSRLSPSPMGGYADVSPVRGGINDVSSSSSSSSSSSPLRGYAEADAQQEVHATFAQQHDVEKQSFNPFLRDPYPTLPVVYSYVPQHMIVPMSFPPGQYGYPQYPMPLDLNKFPPYYSRKSGHFQPLYNYAYDSSQLPPLPPLPPIPTSLMPDGSLPPHHDRVLLRECSEVPITNRERSPSDEFPMRPVVLRSVSDNSLPINTVRQLDIDETIPECKCSTSTTGSLLNITKAVQHKHKIRGVMSKVTGLLKRSQS
jgi:hypothetical protein